MPKQMDARSDPEARRELRVSVHVRGDATDIDNEREIVERRVRFALARFNPVLRRVRVELTLQRDDVACRVQLHGVGPQPISVLAIDADPMLAFSQAIEQAVQALAKRLRRGRELAARQDTSTSA